MNGSQDWLNNQPEFFQTNGNQPPRECLCDPDSDDNCQMFAFNITAGTFPGQMVDQPTIYSAWDRVRLFYDQPFLECITDRVRLFFMNQNKAGVFVNLLTG